MKGVNTVEDHETFEVDVNSLDEARHIGAIRWSVDPSEIEVHVLDEGKRLFGILGKKMHVALSLRSQVPDGLPAGTFPFLEGLLERMDLTVEPEVTGPDSIDLNGEDAPIVIGKSGETLRAVEFLTNVALRGEDPGRRVRIDSGGFKARRQESVEKIALAAAREARRKGRPIRLEPMSSWERRIVHVSLKDRDDVSTCSTGSEPLRRVVVTPVQKGSRGTA
ncbi:MAG: single-stranded DNA-binding protein [Synergistaceae bacterium]|jgi:spoIIIJ-associated protein|nr:single-stranded DNA-binding protein [Synergistales bacterium]MBP8995885.1 single-stranded DNA-binding protein [Synergistales bacterium]NMD18489.1 single-stranded DNA-binding protein [Synergistaceae bacterium]